MDYCFAADRVVASVIRRSSLADIQPAVGRYEIDCISSDGTLKWHDVIANLVPNQGKDNLLNTYFGGLSQLGTWCMSLISAGSATSSSTYASPEVIEIGRDVIPYRSSITWNSATSGTISTAITTFNIIGEGTIIGNMVVAGGAGVTTVGDTRALDGVLLSSGHFSAGNKTVSDGDILNILYSLSI